MLCACSACGREYTCHHTPKAGYESKHFCSFICLSEFLKTNPKIAKQIEVYLESTLNPEYEKEVSSSLAELSRGMMGNGEDYF